MKAKLTVLAVACLIASSSMASDDCDKCNKAVEVSFLACLKKAKTGAEKKECDGTKDKQKQVCQLTKCRKGLF
jgi:hypothetical protein